MITSSTLTPEKILAMLDLEPHVEGGYFRETFRAKQTISTDRVGSDRSTLTSIYYLLTGDRPVDHLHCNQSPIMHYFHGGSAITYHTISPEGDWQTVRLGMDLEAGEVPQLLVPAGYWKTAVLEAGNFGLIGEAVAPGFDYRDMTVATKKHLEALFPQHRDRIQPYIHPDP